VTAPRPEGRVYVDEDGYGVPELWLERPGSSTTLFLLSLNAMPRGQVGDWLWDTIVAAATGGEA
jgi:hypothetical protein